MHEHLYSEKPPWVIDSKLDPQCIERSGKGERMADLAKCPFKCVHCHQLLSLNGKNVGRFFFLADVN